MDKCSLTLQGVYDNEQSDCSHSTIAACLYHVLRWYGYCHHLLNTTVQVDNLTN